MTPLQSQPFIPLFFEIVEIVIPIFKQWCMAKNRTNFNDGIANDNRLYNRNC